MEQNETMLREGSYRKLCLNLCLPTVIIMVVMVVYNMADIFFIGKAGNPDMIAAVSLCGPLFSVLSGLGTLLGSGGCTAISLALGRGERNIIRRITGLCFYGSIVIGTLFLLIILLRLDHIAMLIGSDDTTLLYTKDYLRIIGLGAPVILFSNVFMNLIRADGAARASMIANLLGTALNVALDPLFILAFGWGVSGAAFATVLGNAGSAIYILGYVIKKCPDYSLKLSDFTMDRAVLFPVVSLGLPLAFSTILMSVSHMISNHLMIHYGSIAVAAQGIAGRVSMLISMVAMGLCMGMQPAISYNFASGNKRRLNRIIRNTAFLTVAVGGVLSWGCFVFRDSILTFFIDNAEVLAIGRTALCIASVVGPVYGLYQLCATWLQATGKAGYATVASLLNKGLIFLPVLFVLHLFFGMYGILSAAPVTDALSVFAAYGVCRISLNDKAEGWSAANT